MTGLCCLLAVLSAGPAGPIAFLSGTEQEDLCVCVLDAATGDVTRVGRGDRDRAPVWSPDGQWIAFASHIPDGMGIFVVRPDGSELRQVSARYPWNRWPSWSVDSRRLAYSGGDGSGRDWRAVVCTLETGEEAVWGGETVGLLQPVWLGDGKLFFSLMKIDATVFGTSRLEAVAEEVAAHGVLLAFMYVAGDGRISTDLALVTPSQAGPLLPHKLNSGAYVEWSLAVSPKGDCVAYETNDGGDREIFMMNKRRLMNLTNHRSADWHPAWAPGNDWLAFESFRGGRRGVYRIYPETIRAVEVAVAPDYDNWHPTWAPGDTWIAYVSDRTGDPELWASEVNGTACVQLTDHPGLDYAPAWRPGAP